MPRTLIETRPAIYKGLRMPITLDQGVVPTLVYGTAWKEDDTERLTLQALGVGYRGIDTANQRKHYHEAGVGAAIAKAIASGTVRRDDLFVQTKFTSVRGQDHRLPYDAAADPATQVMQSFDKSLEHLRLERIDSLVLHGPSLRGGWSAEDLAVWAAIEALQASGRVRWVGVSNVSLEQLEALCARARVAPRFVQNRCYAIEDWDGEVRAFCKKNRLVYQGFSLLTANARELKHASMQQLAQRLGKTIPQVVFAFARQVGMQPLTGTSSVEHMREDLESEALVLDPGDLRNVERVAYA
jgi:diketogulonate reductase-like aldo/keto reductase